MSGRESTAGGDDAGERETGGTKESENDGAAETERGSAAESENDGADLIVNERETPEGLLVAVCDADVLGETFEEGAISLTVTEEFYAGEAADAEGVVDSLARAAVANIVGTRAVEVAIDAGVVDEAHVLEVGSTLHAQMVRLS